MRAFIPQSLREIWRYREVLLLLIGRDLKVRYRSSALGFFWSLLNPLLQVAVFVLVFKFILKVREDNFAFKVLFCYMAWMFFNQTILDGTVCIAQNTALVRTTYFPRVILPLGTLGSNLVHFGLVGVMFILIFWVHPVHVPLGCAFAVPLFVLLQMTLMLGLLLMLSSLSVFYSDVRFVVNTFIQLWFFLSPILYSAAQALGSEKAAGWMKTAFKLNPLTPIMGAYRTLLLEGWEHLPFEGFWSWLGVAAGLSVALLVVGWVVFRRLEWKFAEQL